ncbi:MAG: glycosyltransferase [Candidatus Krumholzibacteriia bacterium]
MVSLVITTYNEAEGIGDLLNDIAQQTRPPAELVLVDGGSTDDTVEICERLREPLQSAKVALQLVVAPGAGIAAGRNRAIAAATHEFICVTDAGCRIDRHWCERVTRPLREGRADLVGGFFRPVAHTRLQRVLAALTVADRPPRGFLPSSRSVAFTRDLWRRAGCYPEWLPWGEDTLFNERCLAAGGRYLVAPDAIVHWEVRRSLSAAARQFYRYGWGDGRRRRLSFSHTLNAGTLLVSLLLAVILHPAWLLLFPAYGLLLAFRSLPQLRPADLPGPRYWRSPP